VTGPGRIIALWSSPRSRSTAFYLAMLQRGDLLALHEPFCNIADYGQTDIEGTRVTTATQLIGILRELARTRVVFFKDTSDHLHAEVFADRPFVSEVEHSFLIRRPEEIAASYHALKQDMREEEIGLEHLAMMHASVVAAGGRQPVVVDSDDLLAVPAATMAAYCEAVGLPFRADALRWKPGQRAEWRRSARWHREAGQSRGIEAGRRSYSPTTALSPTLAAFSDHHRPFYERLRSLRLPVDLGDPCL
jgi:Sulfotransferase domain